MAKQNRRTDHDGPQRRVYEKNRAHILKTQDVCALCGKPVDKSRKWPDPMAPCIDHIIPISRGGHPSARSNLQLVHNTCNRQKSDKLQREDKREEPAGVIPNNILPWSRDWLTYRAGDDD